METEGRSYEAGVFILYKELVALQEEVKFINSSVKASKFLKDVVVIHGSPSTLVARVTELEGSLEDAEK